MNKKIEHIMIAVDFDGTIVTHDYPHIGKPVPHAIEVIKKLKAAGHILILLTMRGTQSHLKEAMQYCQDNDLQIDYYNCNPTQKIWTNSEKVYYHQLIDDAAFGCPLIEDDYHSRPYVDWKKVEEGFIAKNML